MLTINYFRRAVLLWDSQPAQLPLLWVRDFSVSRTEKSNVAVSAVEAYDQVVRKIPVPRKKAIYVLELPWIQVALVTTLSETVQALHVRQFQQTFRVSAKTVKRFVFGENDRCRKFEEFGAGSSDRHAMNS